MEYFYSLDHFQDNDINYDDFLSLLKSQYKLMF